MLTLETRPFKFADVIGNEKMIQEFKKRNVDHNFPQVMFMIGSMGTGKTTMSYIVSSLINCHHPTSDNEPCGECASCIDVKNEKFARDITRINGGDLGKDGINEIANKLLYGARFEKNRIVILEEGHLISSAGKEQALLLLEKPKKNTYFIILSTEKEKFPPTILTRGQVYNFKPMSIDVIGQHLINLLYKYDPDCKTPKEFLTEGLLTIAENSGGSVRKAVGDFERCLMGEIFTKQAIEQEFNYISEKKMYELLTMMLKKDKAFFNDITTIDLEEYFNYSWKVLTNSRVVELTITDIENASWQEKSSLQYCSMPNFLPLTQAYEKIFADNKAYFNKNIFYNYIINYYQQNNIPLIKKVNCDSISNMNNSISGSSGSGRKTR